MKQTVFIGICDDLTGYCSYLISVDDNLDDCINYCKRSASTTRNPKMHDYYVEERIIDVKKNEYLEDAYQRWIDETLDNSVWLPDAINYYKVKI